MMTAHTFRAVATAAAAAAVLATVGCTPAVDSAAPVPQPTPSANGDPADEALFGSLQDLGMPIEVRDYVPNMVSCLRERGWAVDVVGDGFSVDAGPEEQWNRYQEDRQDCLALFGYGELGPPSFTAAEAAHIYDVLIEVAPCVRDLGYPVAEPPSQQAFVEALLDHPIPQWHPYDAVAGTDNPADLAHVRRECPVE